MISAIVLVTGDGDAPEHARELAVRSLSWLVSAVVAGVVRDVTAACPPSWPVVDVMEHVGCRLVANPGEPQRLAVAAAGLKCDRAIVLRIGFQPEGPLVAEIDAVARRRDVAEAALLLRAPVRLVERLFPDLAPAVGVLIGREALLQASSFAGLVRRTRNATRLRTRMVPVL